MVENPALLSISRMCRLNVWSFWTWSPAIAFYCSCLTYHMVHCPTIFKEVASSSDPQGLTFDYAAAVLWLNSDKGCPQTPQTPWMHWFTGVVIRPSITTNLKFSRCLLLIRLPMRSLVRLGIHRGIWIPSMLLRRFRNCLSIHLPEEDRVVPDQFCHKKQRNSNMRWWRGTKQSLSW